MYRCCHPDYAIRKIDAGQATSVLKKNGFMFCTECRQVFKSKRSTQNWHRHARLHFIEQKEMNELYSAKAAAEFYDRRISGQEEPHQTHEGYVPWK